MEGDRLNDMLVVEKDEARDALLSVPYLPDRAIHSIPPTTPGNFARRRGGLERVDFFVATHTEHHERAVSIFFDQLALQWMQSDARTAPVGSKCQQHNFTSVVAEKNAFAVRIGTVDFRSLFAGNDVVQFE